MLLARAEQHGKPHPVQDQIGNYVTARDVSGIDRVDKWSPLLMEYRIWLIAADSFSLKCRQFIGQDEQGFFKIHLLGN